MGSLKEAILSDRGGVRVTGPDAHKLLQDLVTCDLEVVDRERIGYGALLTPQGKILFAFHMVAVDDGYVLECPAEFVADLEKRLRLYRLRAKVEIEALPEIKVSVIWGEGAERLTGPENLADPRHPALGARKCHGLMQEGGEADIDQADERDWHAHRIALGIAEFGTDYPSGEMFPHDVNLDQSHGVAFEKGCYVGQEVVSRIRHRGTARRRVVLVEGTADLAPGELMAGDRSLGPLAVSVGRQGLAVIRLDRAARALAASVPITLDGDPVELSLPPDVDYGWPEAGDD